VSRPVINLQRASSPWSAYRHWVFDHADVNWRLHTRRPASADRTARRQFQATGQLVNRTQASDAMTSRLPRYEAKCVQRGCFQCGSVPLRSDIKGTELPLAYILIPLERQLIALQLCRWQFLHNETLQQTFRPLLSKVSKRRQILVLYPHFDEVRGDVEPQLMAHWEARVKFLLKLIELLFLSLTVEALQGKMCQNSLPSGGVGHLEPRFQREGVVLGEYFFGFYKTRHILLSDSANCTVLRAVVLTQYRRVTDRRTDGRTDIRTELL